jgi:hypothetical protein
MTIVTALCLQVISSRLYSNIDYKHILSEIGEKVDAEDRVFEHEIDNQSDTEMIIN